MPVVEVPAAMEVVRGLVGDVASLRRAVASGRRRGMTTAWRRVEFRPVDLKDGLALHITAYDDRQAHTSNHRVNGDLDSALGAHLADGFAHWHIETEAESVALRITKKGTAILHRAPRSEAAVVLDDGQRRAHDRVKPRLLPENEPVWRALGVTDGLGRVKPTKRDKHRQVEDFLRLLAPTLDDAMAAGQLAAPTPSRPLRLVDLGCGNAYLTLAAYAYLSAVRGLPVEIVGVDKSAAARSRNAAVVDSLGWAGVAFVEGTIAGAELETSWPTADPEAAARVDVVLALHACDTATDDALAWAVAHDATMILAAPCCHHDLQRQLRDNRSSPTGWSMVMRQGILRERVADVMTDGLRAQLLRLTGHRVDVVEFVASEHTPRNVMIRAVRTGAAPRHEDRAEYLALTSDWGVTPYLATVLPGLDP